MPSTYEWWKTQTSSSLERTTFTPSVITFHQHAVNATYNDDRRLEGALYMWRAQFNVADLSDIRVREYEFRRPKDGSPDDHGRIRVEVIAVCKVPPTGQGFFVRQGTLVEHVWSNAKETSEPIASSSGLAKISDRWATGEAGNQADLHPDHADRAETGEKQAQGHEGGRLRAEKCGCGTRVSRPYVGQIGRLIPMPISRMLRGCRRQRLP